MSFAFTNKLQPINPFPFNPFPPPPGKKPPPKATPIENVPVPPIPGICETNPYAPGCPSGLPIGLIDWDIKDDDCHICVCTKPVFQYLVYPEKCFCLPNPACYPPNPPGSPNYPNPQSPPLKFGLYQNHIYFPYIASETVLAQGDDYFEYSAYKANATLSAKPYQELLFYPGTTTSYWAMAFHAKIKYSKSFESELKTPNVYRKQSYKTNVLGYRKFLKRSPFQSMSDLVFADPGQIRLKYGYYQSYFYEKYTGQPATENFGNDFYQEPSETIVDSSVQWLDGVYLFSGEGQGVVIKTFQNYLSFSDTTVSNGITTKRTVVWKYPYMNFDIENTAKPVLPYIPNYAPPNNPTNPTPKEPCCNCKCKCCK